jgi:uncharacterized protein YbgA (DUF1722 family)/uncharacterized protein YbbK (DUF523 family)
MKTSVNKKPWPKPQIGISSCLLGNRVRHNGEHKKNNWIVDTLGPFVTWIPICPEVEMHLGVPRETMRLMSENNIRLITCKSKQDLTELADSTNERILKRGYNFDSYIFKKDSPSCGLERVKIYGKSGIPSKIGVGIFSQKIKTQYPHIPIIEEGRLSDIKQRNSFLIRLFTWTRFKRITGKINALQNFHQDHKLQLMAFDPSGYKHLGRIAANSNRNELANVFTDYELALSALLKKSLNPEKNINVFEHMLGYFKSQLSSKEKAHILGLLQSYRVEKIPLASLSTLFKYLIEKHSIEYLKSQTILEPYPDEITIG